MDTKSTKNGIEFQIDSKFEYLLERFCFFANYSKCIDGYYIKYREDGKSKLLHRLLTNCPDNLQVDHISGNTLDNTLSNLRNVTRKQNQRNQSLRSTNTSGNKGVYFCNNYWVASWSDDETGKQKAELFATNKYSNAKELAIAFRKQKELELNITHLLSKEIKL